jgi:hypothetical protein
MVGKAAGEARQIEVDPERIGRWLNGFADRHGEIRTRLKVLTPAARSLPAVAWPSAQSAVTLSAADGATCVLEPFLAGVTSPVPGASGEGGAVGASDDMEVGPTEVALLAGWVTPPTNVALILVRRGGYAVGAGQGLELVGHKVGTRYVQSRTAAGGWSQHRFARRRDNQADALVVSVVEHARRVVLASPADALVVGGDKALVREVLADPRLAKLVSLPRRELFDLPDPRLAVLKQALRRGRAVRITLTEPRSTEPRSTEPRSTEPRSTEPRSTEPRST